MLLLQSVLPNQERSARRAGSFVLDKIDLEQMKHKWLCMAFIAKIVGKAAGSLFAFLTSAAMTGTIAALWPGLFKPSSWLWRLSLLCFVNGLEENVAALRHLDLDLERRRAATLILV